MLVLYTCITWYIRIIKKTKYFYVLCFFFVQDFLLLDEIDHQISNSCSRSENQFITMWNTLRTYDNIVNNCTDFENNTEFIDSCGITILDASAKWTDYQNYNTLVNINLTANPGQCVAVIGPVGAEKVILYPILSVLYTSKCITSVLQSSLIKAILGILPISKGSMTVNGVVSYASQEPWLVSASIQQNILIGSPMDKDRYKQVISNSLQ